MRSLLTFLCAALVPLKVFVQPSFITSLYPTQHALNVPVEAELRVGLQAPLDPASLSDSSIYVWSDITGLHKLTVTLENGNRDLRIAPRHWRLDDRPPFNAGERVTVTLTTRLRYADGRQFEGFTWHYTVAVRQNFGGDFKPEALFGGGGSTYFNVSDFNGDGWPDLIGNDDGIERKMIVFLNDGKGVLNFSHKDNIISPNAEVADLDRDGDQDIAYAGDYLIFNDGLANFTVKNFPERPNGFAKAHDFNNDGIMDFAIGGVLSDTLYFGFSQNEGSFEKLLKFKPPIPQPTFYHPGISYDLNNDGRIDFLYIGGFTVTGRKPGFASFQAIGNDSLKVLQVLELPYEQGSFYGNDFDGDSNIDYSFVAGAENNFVTFLNDGNGQLIPSGLQRDPNNNRLAETVEGGDFDGDGDIDLAFASSNFVKAMPETYEPDLLIYLNDGDGNFSLVNRLRLPFDRPISGVLRAIDFDGDKDLDLIGIANGLFYLIANSSYPNEVAHQEAPLIPIQFSIDPIYPNPVKFSANFQLNLPQDVKEAVHVTILDINGRIIQSWHFNGQEKTIRFTWNVRQQKSLHLSNGVYFVQARTGKFSVAQKLLIQR